MLLNTMFGDGAFILFALLVAAILGFLIAWFLRRAGLDAWMSKYNGKVDEYNQLDRSYKDVSKEVSGLKSNNKGLLSSKDSLSLELADLKSKFGQVKGDLDAKSGISADYRSLQTKHGDMEEEFNNSKAQVNDLMEANQQLENEKAALVKQLNEASAGSGDRKTEKVEATKPAATDDKALKELEEKLKTLRSRNDKLEMDYNELSKNINSLNTAKADAEKNLEDANNEIEKLKGEVSSLDSNKGQVELDGLQAKIAALDIKLNDSKTSYNDLQLTNGNLLKEIEVLKSQNNGDDGMKTKLDECHSEVESLKAKLEEMKKAAEVKVVEEKPAAPAPTPPVSTGDKKLDALNRVREKAKMIDFERIGTATADDKDDLKRIKGIGPFIEEKLNALGIYKFRQIANFTEEDDDKVNDAIEFFSGRVKRDDWKGQAKVLANE